MFFKKKNARFGKYPSCDMLNNAIRFLHEGDTEDAMMEIISAIEKADGYFHEDVKPIVDETKEQVFNVLRSAVQYGVTGITTDHYRTDEAFDFLFDTM